MEITVGIDWAEKHHDVALMDSAGAVVARARIDVGARGLSELLALIAKHGGGPGATPVAIETDKNLLVVALLGAGFSVYAINPRAVARYRERHGQAGAKSDAKDAAVLADILRTDRHAHRPMPAISEQASAVRALARQHQEAIWAMHQTISRLRSVLLGFYPQALSAFPQLKHHAATCVLAAAPTPSAGRRLSEKRVSALLRRCGRRNDPGLAAAIVAALREPALAQPPQVESALGRSVTGLLGIVTAMRASVDDLEQALDAQFQTHPAAEVLRSVPGLGPVLAARVLAEIGDDPNRFTSAVGMTA